MSASRISRQDQEKGYVLSCRVFPKEDLVLETCPF
jgi:Na+-transporting NADH:ubiquinone oxidoreductase subunit NqrF